MTMTRFAATFAVVEREGASAAYIVLRKRFWHVKGEVKNALIAAAQLWKQVYLNARSFS